MGKRKLFLLFLSAMTVSIILMVIIYGLFIKDIDFSFNVKNPESAPSPGDIFNQGEDFSSGDSVAESNHSSAKINTPDNPSKDQKEGSEETALGGEVHPEQINEPPITDVIPLEPQIGQNDTAPIPGVIEENNSQTEETLPTGEAAIGQNSVSSLHYVYLDGFSSREAAEQAIQQLQDRRLVSYPYVRQHNGQVILQFGVFSDRENAEIMAQQLRNQNVYVKVE